ncbi:hypothetical protein [Spiroplasma endosymbiont of Polydrusus pterygomalis]|uniref:hypothetical protein n=1 Tax=Spiroplasma endosymbiont of Polydrusus pterygomalis TaxID=3139327 RepID=UPI003CCAFCAA
MAIIAVLLLTSGIGAIGYEMYRRTIHSNLINEAFVGNKNNKEKNQKILVRKNIIKDKGIKIMKKLLLLCHMLLKKN